MTTKMAKTARTRTTASPALNVVSNMVRRPPVEISEGVASLGAEPERQAVHALHPAALPLRERRPIDRTGGPGGAAQLCPPLPACGQIFEEGRLLADDRVHGPRGAGGDLLGEVAAERREEREGDDRVERPLDRGARAGRRDGRDDHRPDSEEDREETAGGRHLDDQEEYPQQNPLPPRHAHASLRGGMVALVT